MRKSRKTVIMNAVFLHLKNYYKKIKLKHYEKIIY
jgi:hypothetical protein